MSVVSSGWNAELIPEDEILESQFPEVLKELKDAESRKDEIQAQFDSVNEMENEEGWNPEEFDLSNVEVIPKSVIKLIKDDIKKNGSEKRSLEKEYKNIEKRINAYKKDLTNTHGPKNIGETKVQIATLEQNKKTLDNQIKEYSEYIEEQEAKIKKHTDLEEELKECRKVIKAITQRKDQLVEQAREKITDEEAEKLIVARWNKTLHSIVDAYIEDFARNLQLDIEHIYEKYTVIALVAIKVKSFAQNFLLRTY